ncbi:MAG: TonB-dependent receptor [Alphaproteobacteria bacterium]|nr:MAG: TonB-dependent receptor [Alphaproteobacteria bacterium]
MRELLIAAAFLTASGGRALASGEPAETQASFEMAQLETITVYATRNPITAFDFPGEVTVLDRDVIDDFNPSKISDVFEAIPGAQFEGGPRRSGETPSVRGLSGEGVLVLFDGARQSFLSGHDGRFFIDPELVRTVEVVRGPTSALYGSGALGGVIALRTITAGDMLGPGEQVAVRVGGGFQSVNDEWRTSGTMVWQNPEDSVDLVGSVSYRESGAISLGNGLSLPADDEILSSLLKATFRPSGDLALSASWMRYNGDSVDPNNPQGGSVSGPGNPDVDRDIRTDSLQGSVHYAPAGSSFVDLDLTVYRSVTEVEENERDTTRIISRKVETTGVSAVNRSRSALAETMDITFTYGGEFYEDTQEGRDNMTADGSRGGVPDARTRFYGAFLQAELTARLPFGAPGTFSLIPGVRWDHFETDAEGERSNKDDAVSPKIGLSYKPVEEILFFANWAEAFRAPSMDEVFADDVHFRIPNFTVFPPALVTNNFVPNPDLGPEDAESWEIGAGLDIDNLFVDGDRLNAKASYFWSDVRNMIDLEVSIPAGCFGAPFPPCGSGPAFGNFSRYVNVRDAELDGFEFEAQYQSTYIYARANFSSLDGKDTSSGAFVGSLSPDRFFLDAGVKWPGTGVKLGGRITVAGSFDKVNDPTLAREGYVKGDIYAVWTLATGPLEGLRIDLGVDNLADTNYEVVAAGVSQPGRNFKAAFSWRKGF